MDVKFLLSFLFFLFISYKCFIDFSVSIEEKLVNKLQKYFKDIECPAGISLYRLQRNGILFKVQVQTRLPHNPAVKTKIVKRCETAKSPSSSRQTETEMFDCAKDKPETVTEDGQFANLSKYKYPQVDWITSRLLRDSCEKIEYETHECGVPGSDKQNFIVRNALHLSNNVMSYLLEIVKRPDDYSQDDLHKRASEIWSIETLTKGIFPGTLWCGFGNIADDTFGKLGEHSETDNCCRTHDLCKPIIKGFQTRYFYSNPSIVPISHCACDMAFYNCLLKVSSPTSKMIGKIFFNLVKMKCFDFDLKEVCTSPLLGLCFKREERCVAVLKRNKFFPDDG